MKTLKIGIFPSMKKEGVEEAANRILDYFGQQMIRPVEAKIYDCRVDRCDECIDVDIAIAVGGDGTFIGAARYLAGDEVLLCGVNMGTLGFLTDIERGEIEEKLAQILREEYTVEERMMLSVSVKRDGEITPIATAMNDVVVKGSMSMMHFDLLIDDFVMEKYMADGIIVATPTGSTGYSLSSGGPIVNPNLDLIIVTPICPHTLKSRPMVISHREKVRLVVRDTKAGVRLTVDGQVTKPLLSHDEVLIEEAPCKMNFLKFFDKNYYATFKSKLERSN
ncbi:MAG: NAD(+)/NADH kinase [Selenomonadales bacterium]|nr:NAD(+)/NADH kinase [Selenomonadales bacterium]